MTEATFNRTENMERYHDLRSAGYSLTAETSEAWRLWADCDRERVLAIFVGEWEWAVAEAARLVDEGGTPGPGDPQKVFREPREAIP